LPIWNEEVSMSVSPPQDPPPVSVIQPRSAVHRLESRQAQSLFREVNEQIVLISEHRQRESPELELVCECANPSCFATFPIEAAGYESVRMFPTRFIVRPNHVSIDSERVVEETDRYVVVEKFGPAAHAAIQLDPRRLASARRPATVRGSNVSPLRP
jgi:hypothetical protein